MAVHDDLREWVELYALGVLEGEELDSLESHLAAGCDECDAALADSRRVVAELALVLPPVAAPPSVKERLFERVRRDATGRRGSRGAFTSWPWLAAAACLLVAVGLGFAVRRLSGRLDAEIASRASADRELDRIRAAMQSLSGPTTRFVSLTGRGPAATAQARAFLDAGRGRLFLYVYDLPPPPPGRTYQLWLIAGKNPPVSCGVFEVAPNGQGRLDGEPLAPFEGAVTVAVTEEPAGGVPQPTGPMVLVGS